MTPALFTSWREAVGGRRFLMTMGAGLVNSVLLWCGKLDVSAYVTLTLGTVATYIAASTAQKVKADASSAPNPQTGDRNRPRVGGGADDPDGPADLGKI